MLSNTYSADLYSQMFIFFYSYSRKKNFRIGTVSEFLLNNCVIAMALFRTTRPLIPYQQLMVLWKSPRITPRERMFSDSGKSTEICAIKKYIK